MLHRAVRKILLFRAHVYHASALPPPEPPAALKPLIDAVWQEHRRFDQRALAFGDLYRSGFWSIYLLSAIAVLCAILPLALGWDSSRHAMHPFAGIWALGEVLIISLVAFIYWRGHRRDWQGQWLRARTTSELIGYLPMLAPLVDFDRPAEDPDWYVRVFDPGQSLVGNEKVTALCRRCELFAREQLTGAWADPGFIAMYARWTISIFEAQARYHQSVASEQEALQHRIHRLNGWLFGLTALAAFTHLIVHALWLTLVTTFFPALGASLHGALAQSESYRLESASNRLSRDLDLAIGRIRAVPGSAEGSTSAAHELRAAVEAALSMILEEHQDWQMLVMPHRLPLA